MVSNRKPSKEQGCCSVNLLEYLLFVFNFLFYMSGCAVLGIGIWTVMYKTSYVALLTSNFYVAAPAVLIASGIAVIIVGVIGCIGVLRESRKYLLVYALLLAIVFLLELVAGVLAYVYADQVSNDLEDNMVKTVTKRYSKEDSVTTAMDNLQKEFRCCGAINYQDWRGSVWYAEANTKDAMTTVEGEGEPIVRGTLHAPESCCKSPSKDCSAKSDNASNLNYSGCLDRLKRYIRNHSMLIGSVAIAISLVQILGIILSCCLFCKLRDFEGYQQQSSYYER